MNYQKISEFLRIKILDVCYKNQTGHLSSALSCLEILTYIYYSELFNFDFPSLTKADRDRFILSKGHACIGLYAILENLGVLKEEELYSYCKEGSILGGHINSLLVPGTEFSAGSLGHGLAYGVGQALNLKYLNLSGRVIVLVGDGECQEGSIWESAICAAHHKLNNLIVVIDYNKLQASDFVDNISNLEPLTKKWDSFGFNVDEIDGHNYQDIGRAFSKEYQNEKPRVIIAHTIKGNGVSIMAGKNHWHSRRPNQSEWELIKSELGIKP